MAAMKTVIVFVVVVALAGCSKSEPPINIDIGRSVSVEFPNGGSLVLGLTGEVKAKNSGVDVLLKDGRVSIDGKDYGTLKAGDKVKIEASGKVTVNGEERRPTTP